MPVVIFIFFFGLGLCLHERALADPDTGWHIAAGDLIRKLGHLPASDPWSYTAHGARWYDLSWAYDVGLSVIHQLGGLPATVIATIFLYALAVSFIASIALKQSKSMIAAFLIAALAGLILLSGMLVRPQMLSFLLIIAFYAVLRFARPRLHWLLPALTVVWTNVHGGFLTAFVIMGAFFLEAAAARDFARCRRLVVVGAVCALAVFVNPYGWRVFEAANLTLTSALKDFILEWRPYPANEINPLTLLLGALILVSSLYDARIPLADKILAVFWAAMAMTASRMAQVAAILAAPYLATALARRLEASPFGAFFKSRDADYAADFARRPVRIALVGVAALLVGASLTPTLQGALKGKKTAFAVLPAAEDLDPLIEALGAQRAGLRVYNEYGMGGYLIYKARGAPPVFFDGRADTAYPRDVLRDGAEIGLMDPKKPLDAERLAHWRALVERYRIGAFMVSKKSRLFAALTEFSGWSLTRQTENAALFVRADPDKGGARADVAAAR